MKQIDKWKKQNAQLVAHVAYPNGWPVLAMLEVRLSRRNRYRVWADSYVSQMEKNGSSPVSDRNTLYRLLRAFQEVEGQLCAYETEPTVEIIELKTIVA
jgi:hypothetical protein